MDDKSETEECSLTESKRDRTALTVRVVDYSEFKEMLRVKHAGVKDIKIASWQETNGEKPITNLGASPCVIIYAVDRITGRVISGHFPEVLDRRWDELSSADAMIKTKLYPKMDTAERKVLLPTLIDTVYLASGLITKSFEEYRKMKKRLIDWQAVSGQGNVEVFLFGNNDPAFGSTPEEIAQEVVYSAIKQNDLSFDLFQAGIPYAKQHDLRIPGQDNTDDTYYSPEGRIIYHSTRKFLI